MGLITIAGRDAPGLAAGGTPGCDGMPATARPLAAAAFAFLALLTLGAGLLWASAADTLFLDVLTAALPGCF